MEVDGNFHFKRYRSRDDEDGGSSEAGGYIQSLGPASRNIRQMMVDLNVLPGSNNGGFNYGACSVVPDGMSQGEFENHEGSVIGDQMTESFHLDPDQEDEPVNILLEEEEEELKSFSIS
ncbi:hypothetical protein PIB30_034160 [Stylosanthes scabra]|uniref:Uncharacterized protein n=1 Tax=Stylosanthes scabra TaxID=79078 RepID=A0ABU6XAS9_9FABA|nr:hypothetical protein [Stylosanthes scabra]